MPARIALLNVLHMAAKSGCTAVANRFEGFSLMRTEYVSPLREELFFVRAEYIGHFEPMFPHHSGGTVLAARTRSSEPSISSGLFVERMAAFRGTRTKPPSVSDSRRSPPRAN